jgi:hypothetical protein
MAFGLYRRLMATVLTDFPPDVEERVTGYLDTGAYSSLLQWADSYGGALHATAYETYKASQLVALIKKYPFPAQELALQARQLAKDKFLAAEKRCRRYNLKFHRLNMGRWSREESSLQRMASYIRYVLGDQPDLQRIYSECDFGPGASIGVHGQLTNIARKFLSDSWSCTPSASHYARSALAGDPLVWEMMASRSRERPSSFDNEDRLEPIPPRERFSNGNQFCWDIEKFNIEFFDKVRFVQHNKIVFVPKTALVDRTIAVEPLMNGYVQKGVDVYMRRCLKRVGLDLSDQRRNRDLAKLGSKPGQDDPFVTIDLSSASDSITTEVVRRLLPPDWFDLLNSLRSKEYELDGVKAPYEKFVSMGNGFCFPLETLLFASVCQLYALPDDFVVYGDDIIVRQSCAEAVLHMLRYIGFRHNTNKTFLSGPFRESCGADWFEGLDVRPLALDYELDSLESIIKFHNLSLRKPFWQLQFEGVRKLLLEVVPRDLFFARPYEGNIDTAFEVPLDRFQSSPYSSWSRQRQAWVWKEFCRRSTPDRGISSHGHFSSALMMAAVRGSASDCPFSFRRKTTRTVRRMSYAGTTSLWLPPANK